MKADLLLAQYRTLFRIRTFEKLLLEHFGSGVLRGTTHTYLGQEAIAVAAMAYIRDNDIVVSNHRSHGHFLAYCDDHEALLKEIVGCVDGVCRGMGGSQHLHYREFYSNGILGGMVAVATGMALAEKLKKSSSMVVSFLGDGSLGEGIVYESWNMASLWNVPILYVIENNQYAQSTSIKDNLAGSISARAKAFDIKTSEITSNDLKDLGNSFAEAFDYVRKERRPFCQVINTYRLGPHSKGDDYRNPNEISLWGEKDPLRLAQAYFSREVVKEVEDRESEVIKASFAAIIDKQKAISLVSPVDIESDDEIIPVHKKSVNVPCLASTTVVAHLNNVLSGLMESNTNMYLIGEDLADPYGGTFKVTKGLSTRFPGRVISTPISEAGIMGVANGLALRGMRPVVEIMFGDFATLIIDQVVNHATKFKRMYGKGCGCSVIIRTPMGGYRGYGPTHSQSLEKLFMSIQGCAVISCDILHDQKMIWERMLDLQYPILYVENKALYGQKMVQFDGQKMGSFFAEQSSSYFSTVYLRMVPFIGPADVILLAYGGMVQLAMDVAKKYYVEQELVIEVVVPAQISPLAKEDLLSRVRGTNKVIVLEEGGQRNGWGAEISALLAEGCDGHFKFRRCAAKDTIIPNSKEGEVLVLPNFKDCCETIDEVLHAR